MSDGHDTPIKTPKQLITVVALAFIVPIIIIALLVSYVNSQKRVGAGSLSDSDKTAASAIANRIKPVAGFELRDANAPRALRGGEEVYKAQCAACHAVGAAGAPKTGDAGGWAARIKTGYDALLNSALKGKGAMAAQGGGEYNDEEIGRAVVYMANASGGKFAEPASKAAAPPTPAEAKAETKAGGASQVVSLYFDVNKTNTPADAGKLMADLIAYAKGNNNAKIAISGYADKTGDPAKNAELAKQRAFAVKKALMDSGMPEDRIMMAKPRDITSDKKDDNESRRVDVYVAQ